MEEEYCHCQPERLQRLLLRLARYEIQVEYICGKDNSVADALSRVDPLSPKPVDSKQMDVILVQKKIIRIISKVSFDAHTSVLLKEQEILKFSDVYLYQIGKFMYLFKRGLLPNYSRDMFTLESQIHSYNIRNSSLFYILHYRTNFRKFSIRFQGPTFFNSLSREIQNSESISLFGKRLKKFLLS